MQRMRWQRVAGLVLLLLVLLLWLIATGRGFLLLFTLALFPLVATLRGLRHRALGIIGVLFALSLVPVEITFRNVPGPPRLVPYTHGLLSQEGREAEARGELVAGSDLIMLDIALLPKWAWVW